MSDFPILPLGELVKIKGGKRLPKGSALQADENSHPYIRVRDMGERFIPNGGLEYVPDEVFPKIQRYIVKENDVIISIVGTIGLVSVIDTRFHLASQTENCAKLSGLDRADALYLYYFLSSPYGQQEIKETTVGAVQAKLPLYNIEKIPVFWPDRNVREAIVASLGGVDDKIELNRQTNQTLENIAQAIFKSWFVDFEPTRAKIKAKHALTLALSQRERGQKNPLPLGEDLGEGNKDTIERAAICAISGKTDAELDQLDPDTLQQLKTTAALFPDTLVDSELGQIPEGWNNGTLDDLCNLNAKSWTKKNAPEEVCYVDLANTKNGVIEDIQYYSWEEAPSRAKRILNKGDTIIGTVRPGNRSFSIIGEVDKQLTASTGFAVLTPKKAEYVEFVFVAATSDVNIDRIAHLADGGAYPAVRPDVVTSMQLIIPSDVAMSAFSRLTEELFKKRDCNLISKAIFQELRDALLPKLLSGELDINDAV